jgi:hypothetical protein
MPGQRLSLMLRMNHKSYPADLVHLILPLPTTKSVPASRWRRCRPSSLYSIAALEAALRKWSELRLDFPEQWQQMPDAQAAVAVESNLAQLQKQLAEAGSHPASNWMC